MPPDVLIVTAGVDVQDDRLETTFVGWSRDTAFILGHIVIWGSPGDEPQPSSPDLRQRLTSWYDSLPEISRVRPFAMVELERALNTQGKYLSPVLLSLGWERKRKWSGRGQYPRYWMPPSG